MIVYDTYTNTFYDNSERQQTVASDRTTSKKWQVTYIYDVVSEKRKEFYRTVNSVLKG